MPDQVTEAKPDAQTEDEIVAVWVPKIKKAQDNLKRYWDEEKMSWKHWWMWTERTGPFNNNYVPPEVHAAVESVTARFTGERPALTVRPRIHGEMTVEEANALMGKVPHVEELDRYAWQEMNASEHYRRFVKRGIWLGMGTGVATWRTETEDVTEKRLKYATDPETGEVVIDPMTGNLVQIGEEEVMVTKTLYDAPVEEVIDNTDFIYPLGYDSFETLPWAVRRIIKWRSELDETLYDTEKLKLLDEAHKNHTPEDYKTDRLKVLDFPEPRAGETTENPQVSINPISDAEGGNKKDDFKVELWELWIKRCHDYPEGKRYTFANQKVQLRTNTENPTPDGDLPFYGWTPISDTFHLRGMSVSRQIRKAFLYKKRQRDQRLDTVDQQIEGKWALAKDEDVEDDELTGPEAVVRLSSIANVRKLSSPDTSGASLREEQFQDADLTLASGQNDFVQGGNPDRKETATSVERLVQSANIRYDSISHELNTALSRRGKLILKLFQKNWDKARLARILGENGAIEFKNLDPLEFEGDFELEYDVRPAAVYKDVVRQQGMTLLGTVSKIPGATLGALVPILKPLLGTFKEIGINPDEIIQALVAGGQPQQPAPLPVPGAGTGAPPTLGTILSTINRPQ